MVGAAIAPVIVVWRVVAEAVVETLPVEWAAGGAFLRTAWLVIVRWREIAVGVVCRGP